MACAYASALAGRSTPSPFEGTGARLLLKNTFITLVAAPPASEARRRARSEPPSPGGSDAGDEATEATQSPATSPWWSGSSSPASRSSPVASEACPSESTSPGLPDALPAVGVEPFQRKARACTESTCASSHDGDSEDLEARTTVMIRNLPTTFVRKDVEELMDRGGFAGSYDFVHVPADIVTGESFAYAFVNLLSASLALAVMQYFQRIQASSGPLTDETTALVVDWSEKTQGLDALVVAFRNSPIMHPSVPDFAKPAVYAAGERSEFPAPTMKLKPPRRRRGKQPVSA